jgi:hypothetical protein
MQMSKSIIFDGTPEQHLRNVRTIEAQYEQLKRLRQENAELVEAGNEAIDFVDTILNIDLMLEDEILTDEGREDGNRVIANWKAALKKARGEDE